MTYKTISKGWGVLALVFGFIGSAIFLSGVGAAEGVLADELTTSMLYLPIVQRPASTATPTPTASPSPTATASATATVSATATATATPTATATATPVPIYTPWLNGGLTVTQQAGTLTNDGRSVPYRFFIPSPDETRPGPFPAVVFLPGFLIQTDRYLPLSEHVASHGFVVIAADPPTGLFSSNHLEMRDDALAVLDFALVTLADEIDESAIATSGHSLGGKIATMMADVDGRINGLFGIDPVNGAGPGGYTPTRPNILPGAIEDLIYPILMLGQSDDPLCAPIPQNFQTFYDAAISSAWRTAIEFQGADHVDFVDDPGIFAGPCPDGTADEQRVQALRDLFAVAYYQLALNDDERYEVYLLDPESQGVLPGEVVVQHDEAEVQR